MTAFTPGNFRARLTSIETMRACGIPAYKILPASMPGKWTSCPYSARPVALSIASSLGTRWPTIECGSGEVGESVICYIQNCFHDFLVAGAAAEVAGDGFAHLFFGGMRVATQKRDAGNDDARRAIAALNPTARDDCFL